METMTMEACEQIVGRRYSKDNGREIERKIHGRSAKVAVIGLGYAGLHLSVEMAQRGYQVTGIDMDGNKVESIKAGSSYLLDVKNETIRAALGQKRLRATQSFASLESVDAIS